MKRTKLEYLFRRLMDMLNVNYRFHILSSKNNGSPISCQFEWWKRIPGNPLNLNGWMCEELHPKAKCSSKGWIKRFAKIKENKPPTSEYHKIQFNVKSPFSKDDAVFAALSDKEFTSDVGIQCMSSEEQLLICIDLLDIKPHKQKQQRN